MSSYGAEPLLSLLLKSFSSGYSLLSVVLSLGWTCSYIMNTLEQIDASLTDKGFAHSRGREDQMQATFCQTFATIDASFPRSDLQSRGSL